MDNKTNEINEINVYEMALHLITNPSQSDKVKIAILADEIRVYMEAQAEMGMFSSADIYYIVNTVLNETIDVALEWEGSTEYLRTAVVEPIGRAYKAAIESLVEDMGLDQ